MKTAYVLAASFALVWLAHSLPAKKKMGNIQFPKLDSTPLEPTQGPQSQGGEMEKAKENVEDEIEEQEGNEEEGRDEANNENEESKAPKDPETEEEKEKNKEAELNPKLFEGDLKLSKEEIEELSGNTVSKRDAVTSMKRRWPSAVIPYTMIKYVARHEKRTKVISSAIKEFNNKTCVRFRPKKKEDKDYVQFIIDDGCYSSSLGRSKKGGKQVVSLGRGCWYVGTVIHEMMHVIGFYHEHTRLDRDQYVTINWDNIEEGRESQFKKYPHGEADYLNEPYDYESVMHYPRTGFGVVVNRKPLATIVPKDKPWREIGLRKGFSKIDLRQINKLYNCTEFTKEYKKEESTTASS